jgi:anti-sigma factor RsiW
MVPDDLACKELVGLVTDYLDGVLPADWRAGFDGHLAGCAGCTEYVAQIRFTIQALKELKTADSPQQLTPQRITPRRT